MTLRATALVFCVLVTGADCAWDAPPHSDFITFGAGESDARARVLQSREIWPSNSADTDIEFDASRQLAPPAGSPSTASQDGMGFSGGSTANDSQ